MKGTGEEEVRSQRRPRFTAEEGNGELRLIANRTRRPDPLEEAFGRRATAHRDVMAVVEFLARSGMVEGGSSTAETRSTLKEENAEPVSGQTAGCSHPGEAATDNDDRARHG
jgi:hypothetical protein